MGRRREAGKERRKEGRRSKKEERRGRREKEEERRRSNKLTRGEGREFPRLGVQWETHAMGDSERGG